MSTAGEMLAVVSDNQLIFNTFDNLFPKKKKQNNSPILDEKMYLPTFYIFNSTVIVICKFYFF